MGLVRRDAPDRLDHHEVGDRAGQGAPEHPVAGREAGHPVTDLIDDSRVVGPEPGRQAQAEPDGGVRIRGHEPVHRVQPGRGDSNTNLSRSGLRSWNLEDVQDFGAAEGIEPDRSAPARRQLVASFLHPLLSPFQ
jgi:hypothetical protein